MKKKSSDTQRSTKRHKVSDQVDPEVFNTKKQLLEWLHLKGYKVGRATMFRAIKNGTLVVGDGGVITMESVERYIAMAGLTRPVMDSAEAAVAADRKLEEEIKQLELKNAKLEHDLNVMRGKYVEKYAAESEKADMAALMDALPRHVLNLHLPRYLTEVGADATKAQIFFGLFDEDFTLAVNRVCEIGEADIIGE
jgi:hypothetical protein